jgi:hypothetical protein
LRNGLLAAGLIGAGFGLAGCAPDADGPAGFHAMSPDEHLACAVDISAYTYLMAAGKAPEDRDLAGKVALALAWHHNASDIPKGGGQKPNLINQRRTELMAKEQPGAIAARAATCIASAVAKHEAG